MEFSDGHLDTNLWANLVCEIFDQLFSILDERKDTTPAQVDKLRAELAKQSALAAEAQEALRTAELARLEAETVLRKATQERIAEEENVGALLDDLKTLIVDPEVKKQLYSVAEGLGLPKLESSFAELEARVGEVRSLSGRTKALLLAIFTGPGWWKRALLLAVALAVPLGIAWLAERGPIFFQSMLSGAGRMIAQLITAIAALSAWLSVQAKAGCSLVSKLETAYDKVKKARAAREAKDDATIAQNALTAKRQAEEEARHTLRETEAKMKTIRAELAELAPGRQLIRFLKERASAEDYRRHLGLVSLIRRDFEQLSLLLMKAAEEKDTSFPQIGRIVLYIDDLDRCRADRVIEVLEAVHLLLAFPLFAVVVAVDPRWLRQSLLDHYPRLLGGSDDTQAKARPRTLGRPATPQDYLEKIFQVPFNLQAMEKAGFDTLVEHLFPVAKPSIKNAETSALPSRTISTQSVALKQATTSSEPKEAPQPNELATATALNPAPAKLGEQPQPAVPAVVSLSESRALGNESNPSPADPKRLTITPKELSDIQRFQPFFQTPRAVKRLANTYSLIRVGVDEADWIAYLGPDQSPGNYRGPMLLLAVTSAFPSLARPWLLWLLQESRTQWLMSKEEVASLATKHADTTDSSDWEQLASALESLSLRDWPAPRAELLTKWVPRVVRYSF